MYYIYFALTVWNVDLRPIYVFESDRPRSVLTDYVGTTSCGCPLSGQARGPVPTKVEKSRVGPSSDPPQKMAGLKTNLPYKDQLKCLKVDQVL